MKNNQNFVPETPIVKLDFIPCNVLSQPKNVKNFSANGSFLSAKMKRQSSDGNRNGNLLKDHLMIIVKGDLNLLNLKNVRIWNQ